MTRWRQLQQVQLSPLHHQVPLSPLHHMPTSPLLQWPLHHMPTSPLSNFTPNHDYGLTQVCQYLSIRARVTVRDIREWSLYVPSLYSIYVPSLYSVGGYVAMWLVAMWLVAVWLCSLFGYVAVLSIRTRYGLLAHYDS